MNKEFENYCEELWKQWRDESIELPSYIKAEFQTDYLPEPYLSFKPGKNPLYILTTNPGQGMPEQHRDNINSRSSIVSPTMSYKEIASTMGDFYLTNLKGAAKTRIDSIIALSQKAGFDGVVQIEACPFHSGYLPKKNALLKQYSIEPLLSKYGNLVKSVLSERSVIAVSAVGTTKPITITSISSRAWLKWQADLIGFNIDKANIIALTEKPKKITSAFLYSENKNSVNGLVLMMGSNNLPRTKHMEPIIDVLSKKIAILRSESR
jgi:hypothetical protein